MIHGSNKSLENFFASRGLSKQSLSIDEIYRTDEAELYRRQLAARCKNLAPPSSLSQEELEKYRISVKSRVPVVKPVWTRGWSQSFPIAFTLRSRERTKV
jgi:hypothetical protein